jgi:hypothetical protein
VCILIINTFCDLYPLFILLLLCSFVVKFYTIYLLFVFFCKIQLLDFEISIHNLLFHIEIQLLIKTLRNRASRCHRPCYLVYWLCLYEGTIIFRFPAKI